MSPNNLSLCNGWLRRVLVNQQSHLSLSSPLTLHPFRLWSRWQSPCQHPALPVVYGPDRNGVSRLLLLAERWFDRPCFSFLTVVPTTAVEPLAWLEPDSFTSASMLRSLVPRCISASNARWARHAATIEASFPSGNVSANTRTLS